MARDETPKRSGARDLERYLAGQGVPLIGFCACELRSPAQFTEAGFIAFNRQYTETLKRWGIDSIPAVFVFDREGRRAAKFSDNVSYTDVEPIVKGLLASAP